MRTYITQQLLCSVRQAVICLTLLSMLTLSTSAWARESTERGEYLTNILGCGGCHTEGALLGNPSGEWLSGSRIGVAYTAESEYTSPGIIFPGNLTSDKETGLGLWSQSDIVRFLRTGMDHYGEQASSVMPWPNYALLNDQDVNDVAKFLLSVEPVVKLIPEEIPPGAPTNESFVRIGVYLFVPEQKLAPQPNQE